MSTNKNLPVQIGTHRYAVDLRGFTRRPLASMRQMQDIGREPSDASFDNQGVWKRTQADFILGAGQQYLDQEDESQRRMFRDSKNIDVWNRRQLTLLPAVDTATTVSSTDSSAGLLEPTAYGIYAAWGEAVKYYNGTTWTACTNGGVGVVQSFATIGGYTYAADGSTLRRAATASTTFSTFGSTTPTLLGTGGGRLIAAEDNALFEIDNTGASVPIYTHFDTFFQWDKIVAAPNGIYCFGRDAKRSVGYLLTVVDATGELAPPYPVLDMPSNEFIWDALFFGGVLVLATSKGFRMSTINGSGFLTAGPLVEINNDNDQGVRCLATDGRDIWFGWSNHDDGDTGLGRMRPSRFTEPFVPAYARDLTVNATGTIKAVCHYNGKIYFMRHGTTYGTVHVQSADKATTGTFYSGAITYGTPERKAVHSIEGFWDSLPAGSSVAIDILDGLGGSVQAGGISNSTTGSKTDRAELTNGLEGEEMEVKVTLTRATDTTLAPVLRRWTLRAMLLPYRTMEIILALKLNSEVQHLAGGRRVVVPFDPYTEFQYLNGLMEARSIIDVTIGTRTERMMLDTFGIGPDVETVQALDWTKTQDWIEGTWQVRLLTIEPVT